MVKMCVVITAVLKISLVSMNAILTQNHLNMLHDDNNL